MLKKELFNIDRAFYIRDHWEELKQEIFPNGDCNGSQIIQFNKFISCHKILDGIVAERDVLYHQKYKNMGRYFADGAVSIQSMNRRLRHSLVDGIYVDVDIVNAQPSILLEIIKTEVFNKNLESKIIPHEYLEQYVSSREDKIKELQNDFKIKNPSEEMTRDKAKEYFLMIINNEDDNGGTSKWNAYFINKFSESLSNEMKKIRKYFSTGTRKREFIEYKKHKERQGRLYNFQSSWLNFITSDVENRAVEAICEVFKNNENIIPCFDGALIPLKLYEEIIGTKSYDILEAAIMMKTGYYLEVKSKDLDQVITIFKENKPISNANIQKALYYNDYMMFAGINKEFDESTIDEWAKNCIFTLVNGGGEMMFRKCVSITGFGENKTISYNYPIIAAKKAILDAMAFINILNKEFDQEFYDKNKHYVGTNKVWKNIKMKKYKFTELSDYIEYKIKNKEIKQYNSIKFAPYTDKNPCGEHEFNIFTEFPNMNIIPNSDINFEDSMVYKLIVNDLCSGNINEANHLLDTIADIIQDPTVLKPNSHIFVSIKQGVGKSLFSRFLTLVIGNEWVISVSDIKRYFSNFNAFYSNKLLTIFEEIGVNGVSDAENELLKDKITNEYQSFEKKNEEPVSINSCCRYFGNTNNYDHALKMANGARRFTVHMVNCQNAGNATYYNKIAGEISNKNFVATAFHYFRNRKYKMETVNKCFETEEKQRQQLHQMKSGFKFIEEIINESFMDKTKEIEENGEDWYMYRFPFKELNDEFKSRYGGTNVKQDTLKKQIESLGLKFGNYRKHRKSNREQTKCVILYPPIVQKAIQEHIGSDVFKFNFGVIDDPIEYECRDFDIEELKEQTIQMELIIARNKQKIADKLSKK